MSIYYCTYCGESYTEGEMKKIGYVDTPKKRAVFQCQTCLNTECCEVRDYDSECMICYILCDRKRIFECCHWICSDCYYKGELVECPICRMEIEEIKIAERNESHLNKELKERYRKLYIQVHDVIENYIDIKNKCRHEYVEQLLAEYNRWLTMASEYGAHEISPSDIIDKVWHIHILDTIDYARVCDMICGRIIDHYPENGYESQKEERVKRYGNTLKNYKEKYGKHSEIWRMNEGLIEYYKEMEDATTLFVKTIRGKTIMIPLHKNLSVRDLQLMIEIKEGVEPEHQQLIFAGKQLKCDEKDEKVMERYNIQKNSTIHMILNMRGC